MKTKRVRLRHTGLNAIHWIAIGFAGIILLGSLLLSLPCAAISGESIGWFDALFTSTSAVCVTGLVVVDTGTTFSLFGKIVLLCLIQVGGLGFMTFATMLFRLLGRRISLRERMLIRESLNEEGVGGMVSLISWVAKCAFGVELAGTVLLAFRMVPRFGWGMPATAVQYSLRVVRAWNAADSPRATRSVRASSSTPEVSLSRRWTSFGRSL